MKHSTSKPDSRSPATSNQNPALPTELLTVPQAADYAVVSEPTVRRWVASGELPCFRAGRQIRIAREDLVDFLRKGGSGHSL